MIIRWRLGMLVAKTTGKDKSWPAKLPTNVGSGEAGNYWTRKTCPVKLWIYLVSNVRVTQNLQVVSSILEWTWITKMTLITIIYSRCSLQHIATTVLYCPSKLTFCGPLRNNTTQHFDSISKNILAPPWIYCQKFFEKEPLQVPKTKSKNMPNKCSN